MCNFKSCSMLRIMHNCFVQQATFRNFGESKVKIRMLLTKIFSPHCDRFAKKNSRRGLRNAQKEEALDKVTVSDILVSCIKPDDERPHSVAVVTSESSCITARLDSTYSLADYDNMGKICQNNESEINNSSGTLLSFIVKLNNTVDQTFMYSKT